MSKIPVDGLQHVTVVVNDARATARKFADVYGVAEWAVRTYGAERLRDTTTGGFIAEHGYRTATGDVPTAAGPVRFVLVEPRAGWTTYHEFLHTRGEGIHSLCTAAIDPAELGALRTWLGSRDVDVAQSAVRDGVVESVLFDTRAKLGGFFIEILAPHVADWHERQPVDETWTLRDASAAPPLMPIGGIKHFGVVVPHLMTAVRAYAELFGVTGFTFRDWHTAPGSLDNPTYNGEPVEHAYFTTMVTPHENVAFEVIQPTIGPSHYKEDFLLRLGGPGIHHVHSGMLDDAATWSALQERMWEAGVPMVMSGGILHNYIDFFYLDTREALAGFVTEFVVPGANYAKGRPNVPFAMTADLSRPAEDALAGALR
jgi:hypothetical protein